jgi:hypothetical protein
MTRHAFTCVVGNGLSTAYNDALAVHALTEGLLEEFTTLGGGDADDSLRAFAAGFSGSDRQTFEELLAPLEHVGRLLVSLPTLLPVARARAGTRASIEDTIDFLKGIHRVGLGTALSLIDERARGSGSMFAERIGTVCAAIHALRMNAVQPVTVATLNYDGLLHAGFLDQVPRDSWGQTIGEGVFADLSAGYAEERRRPFGGQDIRCWELRAQDDLQWNRDVHLIHLHGYLGWLWHPNEDRMWKFQLEDLRSQGESYWQALRNGDALMSPLVVLTDRKTAAVAEAPFALGYAIFGARLWQADRWLLAGYSGNDEPVNNALRAAARRKEKAIEALRVLVVTRCTSAEEQSVRDATAIRLGISPDIVAVDGGGLPDSVRSTAWSQWSA